MKIEVIYKQTAALVANPRNSRHHGPEQLTAIVLSMQEFGFTNPILIDGDDVVIAGHGRLEAATIIGLAEVPTINLSHLTADQQRAYAIADNKIPLGAEWDLDALKLELDSLELSGYDLLLTGFNMGELDNLLTADTQISMFNFPEVNNQSFDHAGLLPDVNAGNQEPPPDANLGSNTDPDSDYDPLVQLVKVNFKLLMEDKLLLMDTLNKLKYKRYYETTEEALMHLIKSYNEGDIDA